MSDRPEIVVGEGYAVGHIDAIGEGYGFRKVRKELDVTGFGVNAFVRPPGVALMARDRRASSRSPQRAGVASTVLPTTPASSPRDRSPITTTRSGSRTSP
jgi:hypothetical protein